MNQHKVAVLICSSDNRIDILERVVPSIRKFWPDCPYPIYLGLNTGRIIDSRINTLVARSSEWRLECLEQAAQIPATYLIVVLDDFLFQEPVEQYTLSKVVDAALGSGIQYLRLVPLRKSLLARMVFSKQDCTGAVFAPINDARPYYSGLQIALWKKEHLMSLLESPGSIWEFEHKKKHGVTHYAICTAAPISYTHLVDKGRWLPYAERLLRRAGLPATLGARAVWPRWTALRLFYDELRLALFGRPIN